MIRIGERSSWRGWFAVLVVLCSCDRAGSGSASPDTAAQPASPAPALPSAPWFAGPFPREDGYDLWLRYPKVAEPSLLAEYQAALRSLVVGTGSRTLALAAEELERGLTGLLGSAPTRSATLEPQGSVLLGTPASSTLVAALPAQTLAALGNEGYLVQATQLEGKPVLLIAAQREVGVLYGVYALLRHLQTSRPLAQLSLQSRPRIQRRVLNHWDNLDRTVERGYAGSSLWEWESLPGTVSSRYRDYARANASIGINGAVLTNVNANARVLSPEYLEKVAVVAGVLRPYGVRVFLTARFSAPIELGGLKTADPLDPAVRQWWKSK